MVNDPYKVLGVSRDATDEEIKKAYRDLARKYHPDSYAGNPLADLVEEKMKEVNEAYSTIQKERANKNSQSYGYGYGNSNSSYSSGTEAGDYAHIRELINTGRFSEAEIILDSVAQTGRNAEWNFLKGCVQMQRGWYFEAQKSFETACYLEPKNAEYQNALNRVKSTSSNPYSRGYKTSTTGSDCNSCDVCSNLLCADCLCELMGGDLIRCC